MGGKEREGGEKRGECKRVVVECVGSTWEAESKENEMRSVVVVNNIRVLSSGEIGELKSED